MRLKGEPKLFSRRIMAAGSAAIFFSSRMSPAAFTMHTLTVSRDTSRPAKYSIFLSCGCNSDGQETLSRAHVTRGRCRVAGPCNVLRACEPPGALCVEGATAIPQAEVSAAKTML